jgi:excisionase family DNA binding protein
VSQSDGPVLTVKQAAERLGVSPGLVYGLCAARKIRHERHGLGRGAIRIPEAALDEYRQARTVDVEPGRRPCPPEAPGRAPVVSLPGCRGEAGGRDGAPSPYGGLRAEGRGGRGREHGATAHPR